MAEGLSQDEIVRSFCSITGIAPPEASEYLVAADWDADAALAEFYQNQEDAAADSESVDPDAVPPTGPAAATAPPTAPPSYTGPRTLDGRPAPQSQFASASRLAASSRPAAQQKKKGLMTMSSLRGSGSAGGHGHGHDHDDDDDDDEDYSDDNNGRGDLFAGGEKSGLAVHDPRMGGHANDNKKVIRDIISKAKANRGEHSESPERQASSSRFSGAGQTLGGEGIESRVIPGPAGSRGGAAAAVAAAGGVGAAATGTAAAAAAGPVQERVLHIWQDGFSIDDGPLRRYDDPNNAQDLQMIRRGRAPLHLMNIQLGQPVDVRLHEHEENWHQLPRVYRPFGGAGHRLGSPVPGAPSESAITAAIPIPTTVTAAATTGSSESATTAPTAPTAPTVDESQPTLTIRVQLPNGVRLPARFNTTQTIGDVYAFVERAMPAAQQTRTWVLATTFPNKDHTDKDLVLGETAEFKRGGAAVVKWV